jgi:ribose 5-phosphate isomerase B
MDLHRETVAIGSDHAGFRMKEFLKGKLEEWGFEVSDYGTFSEASVDYPDFIHPLAFSIDRKKIRAGIVICGSGNGAAMVANKYSNVRAALCWDLEIARLARLHNNANIIALPARFISSETAADCVHIFMNTSFEGGRHEVRVSKIPGILK